MKIDMAYLKLLLSGGLIITAAMAFLSDNNSKNKPHTAINIKLQKSSRPLIYEIKLTPYMKNIYDDVAIYTMFRSYIEEQQAKNNFIFFGESNIDVLIDPRTNRIRLDILNLQIYEPITQLICTSILDEDDKNSEIILKPTKHSYNKKTQTVVIYFPDYVSLRFLSIIVSCKLYMIFVGSITDNQEGFFKTSYINEEKDRQWLIAAGDFQAIGARQVFPCWDQTLTLNTKFLISIQHNKKYIALSSAPIRSRTVENDMMWTHFLLTHEISPYLITFIVSDLSPISSAYKIGIEMWGRQYVAHKLKFAWDTVTDVTLRLKEMWYNGSNKTDVLLRLSNMNHVAIPNFRDEGMGSFGLVYYSEAAIIYDEALDPIACKIKVAQIVARKTVLLLFGNMFSLSSWSHLWLNEGIATFMGTYIVDQAIPASRMMDLFVVQIQHESLRLNTYYDIPLILEINTISEINSLFSLPRYLKAPVFMRMLQHIMTNENFLFALKSYLHLQFDSVRDSVLIKGTSKLTFDNFWIAIEESLEATYGYTVDLKEKLDNWMVQGHYPVLDVKRNYKRNMNHVIIKLSQKDLNTSYPSKWWIPVTYTTRTKSDFTKTSPDYWLSPHVPYLNISVPRNDWIIVNIQQAGYYRVKYDWRSWQIIADYLTFEDYTRIHVLNRAQIIDDAFHFLSTKQLRFSKFRDLTSYLSRETDYIAWYPMFKIFEQVSGFLPYKESAHIKIFMLRILNGLLNKIGYEEIPTQNALTACLRQEAAKWACTLGSSVCTEKATKILDKHLSYPITHNLLPGWQDWTYCRGLMTAKSTFWNKIWNIHSRKFKYKILKFLTCSEDSAIILDYMMNIPLMIYNKYISDIDHINIFHSLVAKAAKDNLVLDILLVHFDIIKPRQISTIVALIDIINHVYSEEQFDKISKFIKNNVGELISHVQHKIETRLSEIVNQIYYFQSFLEPRNIKHKLNKSK